MYRRKFFFGKHKGEFIIEKKLVLNYILNDESDFKDI